MKICRICALALALVMVLCAMPALGAAAADDTPPSAYSLLDHNENGYLPPIDHQGYSGAGGIGSCVGEAVTYMQFTNAVARYMQDVKGDKNWKPSDGSAHGNDRYIFSPKWTLNYSGAGTQWVYDILLHMGAATQDVSKFHKNVNNWSQYYQNVDGEKVYFTESTSWDVGKDVMWDALNFRLGGFQQYWTRDIGGGQVTTSVAGKQLIDKIKKSILDGNVVVTGGPSGKWGQTYYTSSIGQLTANGDISKAGEYVCFAAQGNGAGGHQVSIIGWDDNATFTRNGVTMKGAFLVANSWGDTWMNKGCLWFMYDSINAKSQFAAQDATLNEESRESSLDQFCFTDWTKVKTGQPALTVTAEVTTKDREGTTMLLTRTDKETGETVSYQPVMFYYGDLGYHEKWDVVSPHYMNYKGELDGDAASAEFSFSYEDLIDNLPAGKSRDDYYWGFRLVVEKGNEASVGAVKLRDASGKTLYETTNADLSINASAGDVQGAVICEKGASLVMSANDEMYHIVPAEGQTNPVPVGGDFSFTVEPVEGYTLKYGQIAANGEILHPSASGVYTVKNVQHSLAVSVANVQESASYKRFTPTMYNGDGWEYYGQKYVMVINIPNAALRPDFYAKGSEVGTAKYPYYFRLTDTATGESYYMQPVSTYAMSASNSTLYRLPFLEGGLSAKLNENYNFKLEVLYEGHVLYSGALPTKCQLDNDNANGNPPQKGKDTVTPSGTVHKVIYRRGGEVIATDVFLEGDPIVARAVAAEPDYKVSLSEELPATMGKSDITVDIGDVVYARGDVNEDGKVGAKDLTRLLQLLSDPKASGNAAFADADSDGSLTISDVSFLVAKLSNSARMEEEPTT